jgi:hypothetical protein
MMDAIPNVTNSPKWQLELKTKLGTIIGSLNWISTQTWPDIATITNILAQYQSCPSLGHIDVAKHTLCYLKGTCNLSISFSSKPSISMESFIKFPIAPNQIHPFSDANWGPQNTSVPKSNAPPQEIDLFKSRPISGFLANLTR